MKKRTLILLLGISIPLWIILFTTFNLTIKQKNALLTRKQGSPIISVTEKLDLADKNIPLKTQGLHRKELLVQNDARFNKSNLNVTFRFYNNLFNETAVKSNTSETDRKQFVGKYVSCATNTKNNAQDERYTYPYFKLSFEIEETQVKSWISRPAVKSFCENNVRVFDDRFALIKDVVVDISKRENANKKPKGGEKLKDVLRQREDAEFFKFWRGFLKVRCDSNDILDDSQLLLVRYLEHTSVEGLSQPGIHIEEKFTLAITRGDYVNLHNFIRQMYNAFLLMMIFKKEPKELSILFLDGHPEGMLDKPWFDIFSEVVRVGNIPKPVLYKHLILGFKESDGGLVNFQSQHMPYIEEFRSFFLQEFRVYDSSILDCKKIKITIILRRDKVFHPRNEMGIVGRKIFNEHEIIGDLLNTFPNTCVHAVLMDSLPLRNQLEIVSATDILIGMHGAGMIHSVFLPKHAAILEIFPKDFKQDRPWYICYEKIAQWRGLMYSSWENFDGTNEMPYAYTLLPRNEITKKITSIMKQLCHSK